MGQKGDKHTASSADACAMYEELLAEAGDISSKKMFGGHGLFESGVMFGMVNSWGALFFRVGDDHVSDYEQVGARKHGKMPYWTVPDELLDDKGELLVWASRAIATAHALKKK